MPNDENGIARHAARKQALEVLFQAELGAYSVEELLKIDANAAPLQPSPTKDARDKVSPITQAVDENAAPGPLIQNGPLDPYAERLIVGSNACKAAFDEAIALASDNWSLNRMPAVDRNIMRIALYEMLLVDEVDTAVSIDESVELAKEYGTEDSPRFVNGVLGKIARDIEQGTSELVTIKEYFGLPKSEDADTLMSHDGGAL